MTVRENDNTIRSPYFILRSTFGIRNLGLNLSTISLVKISAKRAFSNLPCDPLPGKPQFNLFSQFASWLFQAPDERGWIEPRGIAPLFSPLSNVVVQASSLR